VLSCAQASDGIWDLWEYEEVFEGIASAPTPAGQGTETAMAFFTKSVSRGAEMFDDAADNMTGMVVYLNPRGIKVLDGAAGGAKAGAAKGGGAKGGGRAQEDNDPSRFSV
jgi:serine/threonine protein phosphatase PrpC